MDGVKQVKGFNDRPRQWTAGIAHPDREWEAKITEQTADERLAASNRDGAINGGFVIFQQVSDAMSTVLLQLPHSPDKAVETNAEGLEVVSSHMQGALERFKAFAESRGQETATAIDSLPY